MITTLHIIKFIGKLLLLIIFLPMIFIWCYIKLLRHKFIFKRFLMKAGMPKKQAQLLAKEIGIKLFFPNLVTKSALIPTGFLGL